MLKKKQPAPVPQPVDIPRVVNGVMKLKGLWEHPDLDHLMRMLDYARDDEDIQVVEQQWTNESQNNICVLKVSAPAHEEPIWTLQVGTLGRPLIDKWRYPTGDVSLVLNLITSESTGTNLSDLISTSRQMIVAPVPAPPPPSPAISESQTEKLRALTPEQVSEAQQASTPSSPSMLQGDLKIVRLHSVLQSIRMSKMTGRLELRDKDGLSDVYFDEGTPVHAEHCGTTGDLALIELLSWQTGQFCFHAGERTSMRTVKNRLDALLMEGMTFADQSTFLEQQGLNLSSFPIRKNPHLKQTEFEEIVKRGSPIDMRQAMNIYCQIDDTINLLELLRVVPLHKTEWVPIFFNFITQELISLSDRPALHKKAVPIEGKPVDLNAAESAIRSCIRAETGIFTYDAFVYFLQQEFQRHEAGGMPFSVLLMEARIKRGNALDYLPEQGMKETIGRIQSLKRPFETLAHFETFDYALLLPQTELRTATLVAQRLVLSLKTIPKVDFESDYLFWIGVAGVPGDGRDVATLLTAAQEAKARAVQTQTSVCMFRTLLG